MYKTEQPRKGNLYWVHIEYYRETGKKGKIITILGYSSFEAYSLNFVIYFKRMN